MPSRLRLVALAALAALAALVVLGLRERLVLPKLEQLHRWNNRSLSRGCQC